MLLKPRKNHKMKKILASLFLLAIVTISCVRTKNTIKNIDNSAAIPQLNKSNAFVLKAISKNSKYGYDKDYPVNVYYKNSNDENLNAERFINALAGPKGEIIQFQKLESCCPFPSKQSELGAGFLDVYQITYSGLKNPKILYLNIYERGVLEAPVGLTIKNP